MVGTTWAILIITIEFNYLRACTIQNNIILSYPIQFHFGRTSMDFLFRSVDQFIKKERIPDCFEQQKVHTQQDDESLSRTSARASPFMDTNQSIQSQMIHYLKRNKKKKNE